MRKMTEHYIVNSDHWSTYFCQRLMCLSLQVRQLILPWFIGGTTVVDLMTDTITVKNVLLNFLAVSVLVEADNMLSWLSSMIHLHMISDLIQTQLPLTQHYVTCSTITKCHKIVYNGLQDSCTQTNTKYYVFQSTSSQL